jgi:hypothetical protein
MARHADTAFFNLHPSSAGVTLWLGLAGVDRALQVRDTVACSINGIVQALALALEFAGVG